MLSREKHLHRHNFRAAARSDRNDNLAGARSDRNDNFNVNFVSGNLGPSSTVRFDAKQQIQQDASCYFSLHIEKTKNVLGV